MIRILIEKALALPLADARRRSRSTRSPACPAVQDARAELANFIYERLRGYLREHGYTANQVEAVLVPAAGAASISCPRRLAAVQAFATLPEADALAAANKRIVNILRKSGQRGGARRRSRAPRRRRRARPLSRVPEARARRRRPTAPRGDFAGALKALAAAKPAVDRFFDDVMVMADDPAIRANRLALLRGVAQTMNRVADISKLAGVASRAHGPARLRSRRAHPGRQARSSSTATA